MEKQNQQPNELRKKPYDPPKAKFIPLKLEEKLFGSSVDIIVSKCGSGIQNW